jgi:outer membrane protein assembly factor BamB
MPHFFRSFCLLALLCPAILAQEPNWNQFRGPNNDNHSASTGIADSWGAAGPKLLWKIDKIGGGYSNISFYGDMMFTLGDIGDQCFVIAMERKTGNEIWKTAIGKSGDGGGGYAGPLGTPACDGENVYVLNQFSDFAALNMKDGKILWQKNTQRDFGAKKMSGWGYAMSPILDGDKILLPVGGDKGSMIAVDKTGKLLWQTDWIKDSAAYTSIVPITFQGVRQYMLLTEQRLVGVSTEGKFLWGANFPGKVALCSNPVLNGDVVMATCAYRVGGYFYRISKSGNEFTATDFHGADQKLACQHGGMVAVGDHFYMLGEGNTGIVCIEAKTAKVVWENRSVGKGSLTYVDGKLILRNSGVLFRLLFFFCIYHPFLFFRIPFLIDFIFNGRLFCPAFTGGFNVKIGDVHRFPDF